MCVRVVALLALYVLPIPCEGFVPSAAHQAPCRSSFPPAPTTAAPAHDDEVCGVPATSGKAILCKTAETFKLADLYHLERSIQASSCGMTCHRLGIDPATGSSLLLLTEGEPSTSDHASRHDHLDFRNSRSVEWVGIELASARDASALVDELRQRAVEVETIMRNQAASSSQNMTWTLEYCRMGNGIDGGKERPQPRHTSKTLCYGVANALALPPELDKSNGASSHLVLLDGPDKIRLCFVISRDESGIDSNGNTEIVRKVWPGRPFQYSSAMNPTVARIVVDILLRMCRKEDKMNKTPTLLDPTCGSGTFLAFALANGANVIGWDINESCCEGARRNLDYLTTAFVGEGMELSSSDLVDLSYRVDRQDAALVTLDTIGNEEIDCAVANLPWGRNTPTYFEENSKILQALRGTLRTDIPVAIISRDSSVQKEMERLGFCVVGTASIPQSNFRLPNTSKNKKRKEMREERGENADVYGRNHQSISSSSCVITIAVTS